MSQSIFITGIGTSVGNTLVSAIVAEALEADYWKPIQAGIENGTDTEWVHSSVSNSKTRIHPESYKLQFPASPHLAAQKEGISITLDKIYSDYTKIISYQNDPGGCLVIEGAGGLMVPLNQNEFVIDMVQKLGCKLIIVSRNYLGSINHSLLTALAATQRGIPVCGWIFNDHFLNYEHDIVAWSGYSLLGAIPFTSHPDKAFVRQQAALLRAQLVNII